MLNGTTFDDEAVPFGGRRGAAFAEASSFAEAMAAAAAFLPLAALGRDFAATVAWESSPVAERSVFMESAAVALLFDFCSSERESKRSTKAKEQTHL